MDPPWEAVMYNYTMRHFRSRFTNIIHTQQKLNPDRYDADMVPEILYKAGARCLAEGKEINYINVLNILAPKGES